MSQMSVEFAFDDQKLQKRGMNREAVYSMLKQSFKTKGIPCVADDEVLTFAGNGRNEDYGCIWSVIIKLIDSDWFEDCATRCMFVEDGVWDDLIPQIPTAKKVKARAMRGFRGQQYA